MKNSQLEQKSETINSSSATSDECPEQPEIVLDRKNVQVIAFDNEPITFSGIARKNQSLGYTFEAKSGQKFNYRTQEDICIWIYTPDNQLVNSRNLPVDGKYTIQLSAPKGSATFEVEIGLETHLETISQKLKISSSTKENLPITSVSESLNAEQLTTQLAESTDLTSRQQTKVQYFSKNIDRQIVESALSELGFTLISAPPNLPNAPTNSIWFGNEVAIEDIKLVAYTLIRAGVEIKAIRPFRNSDSSRSKLIQIGSDAEYLSKKSLTVNQILQADKFTR